MGSSLILLLLLLLLVSCDIIDDSSDDPYVLHGKILSLPGYNEVENAIIQYKINDYDNSDCDLFRGCRLIYSTLGTATSDRNGLFEVEITHSGYSREITYLNTEVEGHNSFELTSGIRRTSKLREGVSTIYVYNSIPVIFKYEDPDPSTVEHIKFYLDHEFIQLSESSFDYFSDMEKIVSLPEGMDVIFKYTVRDFNRNVLISTEVLIPAKVVDSGEILIEL